MMIKWDIYDYKCYAIYTQKQSHNYRLAGKQAYIYISYIANIKH